MRDFFGYKDKVTVVTGAASGIGEVLAKLLVEVGADVYALDVRGVSTRGAKYCPIDLARRDSIEAAIEWLPARIDKIFACSGIAGASSRGQTFSVVDVIMINFVGHRHLIEALLPRMTDGGAIAMIASFAGFGWLKNIEVGTELLSISDFDEVRSWLEARVDDPRVLAGPPSLNRPYNFSKELLVLYAKQRACQLTSRNIRINTVSPGFCETPLSPNFREASGRVTAALVSTAGRTSIPEEQALPLLFLNSDMASYVSGADLAVDLGIAGAVHTGQFQVGKKAAGPA